MKRHLIIRLVATSLMIILGAIIYIVSRRNIIFFDWLPTSIIEAVRDVGIYPYGMDYFVVFCLPDGLWYGALLLFQHTFLAKSAISKFLYWISIILPFVWEILQIHKYVPGTFDFMDLLTYLP